MPHKRSSSNVIARFDDLQPFSSIHEVDEYLNNERIECLLCSKKFAALYLHLLKKHGIVPDSYKAKLGLSLGRGLVGTRLHEKMRTNAIEIGASENLSKKGNYRTGSHRKSRFQALKLVPVQVRAIKFSKERSRGKLLEGLRHCSRGMSIRTMAKLSGIPFSTITSGFRQHRDINAAFMELTR